MLSKWVDLFGDFDQWLLRVKTLLGSGELGPKQEFECHAIMLKLMMSTMRTTADMNAQVGELTDEEASDRLERYVQRRVDVAMKEREEAAFQKSKESHARERLRKKCLTEDDGLTI